MVKREAMLAACYISETSQNTCISSWLRLHTAITRHCGSSAVVRSEIQYGDFYSFIRLGLSPVSVASSN